MSTTPLTQEIERSHDAPARAGVVWLTAVQIAAVGLLAYALWLVGGTTELPRGHQALLILLAAGQLLLAIVPALRRGPYAGILGGVTLATACWLTADTVLEFDNPDLTMLFYEVPKLAPVVLAAALVLVIWGGFARAGLADTSRLGVSAVAGGVLVGLIGAGLYCLVNFSPMFKSLYGIDSYQLMSLLAAVTLYPAALWLGGVGVRPTGGWRFQPLVMAILLAGFFAYARLHGA